MLQSDAVAREQLYRSEGVSFGPRSSTVRADTRRALVLTSVALFVIGAWPLALSPVPPFQDLPNHLATISIIRNLDQYPEYAFNGFFKTNAALFAWLYVVGKYTGLNLAARLFALLTLALNAIVFPRFVLDLGGSRKRMVVASLFVWPMIHNWFVSMGMLDFALAVPLALALLLMIDRQRKNATVLGGAAIVFLGGLTWYAHAFPLLVVHMLVGIELVVRRTWKERMQLVRASLPLAPATALVLLSVGRQINAAVGPNTGNMNFEKLLAPWELLYNLWAEWFWGFTNLTLSSMVPCVVLGVLGVIGLRKSARDQRPMFFSPWAILALVLLYCFVPYKMTNWFHVNSRFIPFLWLGLALYLPERLPRWLVGTLGVSALLYTAGMGIDYVRLERERKEFLAGMDAVPEGARLLPLVFKHKGVSVNTRNLLHEWGFYITEKHTASPLVFAHSRSFPITYQVPPPIRFNHLVLESFAPENGTPAEVCHSMSRFDECDQLFDATWHRFFDEATPRYDHLLLWDATPEALAMVPPVYEQTFSQGRLKIFAQRK